MAKRFILVLSILSILFCLADCPLVSASSNVPGETRINPAYEMGENELTVGNIERAYDYFQAALTADPSNLRIHYRLGQTFFAMKKFDRAFSQFQQILRVQPENISARFELAKCLIKMGNEKNGREHLEWILSVYPNHHLARALIQTSNSNMAQTAFVPLASGQNQSQAAPQQQLAPQKVTSQPKMDEMFVWGGPQGKQAQVTQAPPEARKLQGWKVSDFLKLTEGSLSVAMEYAKFCLEKGDIRGADAKLALAQEIAVRDGKTERILEIQVMKSLLTLYQADIRGFGKILMKIKPLLSKQTLDSFLEIYNKTMNMSSSVEIARVIGGVAMGAEHYQVASNILTEVVANSNQDSFALKLLGHSQMESGKLDEAEKTFRKIVQFTPNDSEANFNLGRFYLTSKFNLSYAKFFLQKARSLSPNDERISLMDGVISLLEGKDGEGTNILHQMQAASNDQGLREMARHILDIKNQARGDLQVLQGKLLAELAVPGSTYISSESLVRYGKAALKKGSLLKAMKYFNEARALAEIGRIYLALASNLATSGETEAAAIAAGFGMNALQEELRKNPNNAAAHLYLALYHVERNDFTSAKMHVEQGLRQDLSPETKKLLMKLKETLG